MNTSVDEIRTSEPSYMRIYPWENIQLKWWRSYLLTNWSLCVYVSIAYIIVIFSVQSWMKNREAYDLKRFLSFWNAGLAIFSICGVIRLFPEMSTVFMKPNGIYTSMCVWDEHNIATAFWMLLFTLSKLVELGDTLFVVLRKQKLIFLHWYHHFTVLSYCWITYGLYEPRSRWFMLINYFIHSWMYSYYALMSFGFKIPRHYAKVITISQMIQMVIGFVINVYCLWTLGNGHKCRAEYGTLYAAILMYGSYLILFGNFFINAYGGKPAIKPKQN